MSSQQTLHTARGQASLQKWLTSGSESSLSRPSKRRRTAEVTQEKTNKNTMASPSSTTQSDFASQKRLESVNVLPQSDKGLSTNELQSRDISVEEKNLYSDDPNEMSRHFTKRRRSLSFQQTPSGLIPTVSKTQAPESNQDIVDLKAEAENEEKYKAREHKNLRILEVTGDIFDAPSKSVIIHACNCVGSWGAGIAAAFKSRYPHAYTHYNKFCTALPSDQMIGTAQLIGPSDKSRKQHYIGCLYTSQHHGKRKDTPQQILDATGPAIIDLLQQIGKAQEADSSVAEIRMCEINSGLFNVPWAHTKAILQNIKISGSMPDSITVYSRAA